MNSLVTTVNIWESQAIKNKKWRETDYALLEEIRAHISELQKEDVVLSQLPQFPPSAHAQLQFFISFVNEILTAAGYNNETWNRIRTIAPYMLDKIQKAESKLDCEFQRLFPKPNEPVIKEVWEQFADECLTPYFEVWKEAMSKVASN